MPAWVDVPLPGGSVLRVGLKRMPSSLGPLAPVVVTPRWFLQELGQKLELELADLFELKRILTRGQRTPSPCTCRTA